MENKDVIIALLTLLGLLITGYISWRLGRLQLAQQEKQTDTSNEAAFAKNLLELIDQQEEKLQRQDAKIDSLLSITDTQRGLLDEFRKANWLLTFDKQRLERRVEDLEKEAETLRRAIERLNGGNAL